MIKSTRKFMKIACTVILQWAYYTYRLLLMYSLTLYILILTQNMAF